MNKIRKITLISILLFALFLVLIVISNLSNSELSFIYRNVPSYFSTLGKNSFELPQREIDVIKYDIEIEVFNGDNYISETTRVFVKNKNNDKKSIELDLYDGFQINSVKVNNVTTNFDYSDNKIKIFNNFIVGDTSEIAISFEGAPQNLGIGSFWNEKREGKQFLATLNEPIFASTWFPCNDTPNDKALLNMSITNDSSLVSLSNGKLVDVINRGNKKTYIWNTEYPIATYLISIYSGEYVTFNQKYISKMDTMNIDYYVTSENLGNAKIDFANHPKYLKVFSELFGEYPFLEDKYGVAEILWQQGAMESQTITGIGSNFISGLNFHEDILIHEVAHHWWGNSVTPKTWKDIWLNEGFATYSEALYYEKTSSKDALISTMASCKSRIYPNDSQRLYSESTNIFSRTIYDKGAWVLHMLRKEIGDSLFFTGLKNYYSHYKYANSSTQDLQNTFEKTSKTDLQKFFDQWVFNGNGYIELNVFSNEEKISKDSAIVHVRFEQTQDGYENYNFPIDIEIKDSLNISHNYTFYIRGDTTINLRNNYFLKTILFDKDNWLLADFNN